MNYNEAHGVKSSRQPTGPPFSSRTLHHPSLLPVYMAAGFAHHHAASGGQTGSPVNAIIPAECFYTDPTMSCGRRIPNRVSELRVFDSFQLNTPPPVMSAYLTPPTRPDPFRSGPHPTRDLGSRTLKINPLHPPVQPSWIVLQLTQEEDQVVTNLLKLHHQEPIQSDTAPLDLFHLEPMDSALAEEVCKPLCGDVQHPREASLQGQRGRCWSDTELDAANTLLSRFSLTEEDTIWDQNHNQSAATLPDLLPHQRQGSETLPVLMTTACALNNSCASFSPVRESGELGWEGLRFPEGRGADDVHLPVCEEYLAASSLSSDSEARNRSRGSGDFSEERLLPDSERDAVHVLLSLGDIRALDIMQLLS